MAQSKAPDIDYDNDKQSSFYAARRYATDVESNSVTDVFMAVK